jgi:hypothetical protein
VFARNARDVPMLNERHPWVASRDLVLADREGAAFDVLCRCGELVPTGTWWSHAASCRETGMSLEVVNSSSG